MKKWIVLSLAVAFTLNVTAVRKKSEIKLRFDATKGVEQSMIMPQGDVVEYTAYERLYYVKYVEDTTFQYLNVYVPKGATAKSPVFLRTYVGGYMAAAAGQPQADDASGRALKEGYVVVIPGTRGRNSSVKTGRNKTVYNGRAPKALLDLKAAVRYLRLFDGEMAGDAERIVVDGTSAGGAMAALLGATGNHPDYEVLLKDMGAADTRDDVFAVVSYCPITDLNHADAAYEWMFGQTERRMQADEVHRKMSEELAAQYPAYLNGLNLRKTDGSPLTANNYIDYLASFIIEGAQRAKDAGADIPQDMGFTFSMSVFGRQLPAVEGERTRPLNAGGRYTGTGDRTLPEIMGGNRLGEYITGLDMTVFLNYITSRNTLKTVPAFDSEITSIGQSASGENALFGNEEGMSANFTDYTAAKNGQKVSDKVRENVRLLNPMNYIDDHRSAVAHHWYIRHGAIDLDTAYPVAINLATKLDNTGKNVDFLLAWNRPHSGDYALNELFGWLKSILR